MGCATEAGAAGEGAVRRVPRATLRVRTGGVVVPDSEPREGGGSVEGEGEEVALARAEGREPHVSVVRGARLRVQDLRNRARVPAAAQDVQVRRHRGHLALLLATCASVRRRCLVREFSALLILSLAVISTMACIAISRRRW